MTDSPYRNHIDRTIPPLELGVKLGVITLCDQRTDGDDRVASITFSSPGNEWGEFITWEQLLAVKGWIDALIELAAVEEREVR